MTYTFTAQRMTYTFATLAECSETYSNIRRGLDLDMHKMRPAAVLDETGKQIGYIGYNGRIWSGRARDWTPETPILFDNRRS